MNARLGTAVACVATALPALALGAGPAYAANPGGASCAADGGINGRGATFQTRAHQDAFIPGFNAAKCPSRPGLVQYNYAQAIAAGSGDGGIGSGNGLKATSCRSDAFGGTDIPYTLASLAQLNGVPGATGGCNVPYTPPNPPAGPFPKPGTDAQANAMSFPIAASSVTVAYNLPSTCGTLNLTGKMVSQLFGGEVLNWNDPKLRAAGKNASLASCNLAVTRAVRNDKSGTTQIFKNYLNKVDRNRTGSTCGLGSGWDFYAQDANNQAWPNSGTCSTLSNSGPGNSGVAAVVSGTSGAVGYVDLADSSARTLKFALVKTAVGAAYASPQGTTKANCDVSKATLPSGGSSGAVGLNPADTWATDNAGGNRADVTNTGSKYPICGLTFSLVYKGIGSSTAGTGPIAGLNQDQKQTLYDYYSYVLSTAGQKTLQKHYYAKLPTSWVSTLLAGFQANF